MIIVLPAVSGDKPHTDCIKVLLKGHLSCLQGENVLRTSLHRQGEGSKKCM